MELSTRISHDYLGKIMPAYYFFTHPLIEERRKLLKFERGSGSLEYCAEKWRIRLLIEEQKSEEQRRKNKSFVKPKPPLE